MKIKRKRAPSQNNIYKERKYEIVNNSVEKLLYFRNVMFTWCPIAFCMGVKCLMRIAFCWPDSPFVHFDENNSCAAILCNIHTFELFM